MGLLFFGALGVFWFFFLMNPWISFLNSDDAVPYQQAISEWRPQDLYYWGTSRFGMLYEVLFKTVLSAGGWREQAVGSSQIVELFYLFHVIFMCLGFAFWLPTLRTFTSKIVFLIFFFPLSHLLAWFFLTPGQLYGVLFTLNGLFFWCLQLLRESRKKHVFLGLLVGIIWIQHELAGAIALGIYGFCHSREFRKKKWLFFLSTFLPLMILCYGFKGSSRQWTGVAEQYGINSPSVFIQNLWLLIRDGSWWIGIRRGTGHVFTIGILTFLFLIWKNRREKPLFGDRAQIVFFASMAGVTLILFSQWYVINGHNPRYFTCVFPLLIWSLLQQFDQMPRAHKARWILFLACVVPVCKTQGTSLWLNPFVRSQLHVSLPAQEPLFQESAATCNSNAVENAATAEQKDSWSSGWKSEACLLFRKQKVSAMVEAIEKRGCAGYIDDYWNSHILAVYSSGRIMTSAGDNVRNPELMKKVLSTRPLCVMPREGFPFQNYTSNLNCEKMPEGFLRCNSRPLL